MPCPPVPADSASFGEYLNYYTQRAKISQNRLAICARINQSYLNKLANGRINDAPVDTLVSICLALRLSQDEARDLLARKERAFSPANPTHQIYMELIDKYHMKQIDYKDKMEIANFLVEADAYLAGKGCPVLPNANYG